MTAFRKEIAIMKDIGIYIHIPFCKQKCYYCDFISYSQKEDLVEKYIDTIINEIENAKLEQYNIKTVYIGGGTPSYINHEYILKVIDKINFDKDEEVTIEINPGTATLEKLKAYYNAGVNRISIGLQVAQDKLLQEIGRIHTWEEFVATYKIAQEVGFENINVDIMLGLPNQTIKDLNETLDEVIKLNPNHISIYSLILEEGTLLEKKIREGKMQLPDENIEREMYWNMKKKLEESGYVHYEISNFAKPKFESKHNMDCWEQSEYIGFGVSAHSYLNNIRYSNAEIIEQYIENYTQKQIEEKQTPEAKKKEYMLLGLRKICGVSISEFERKFKVHPLFYFRFEISKLVEEKLLEIDLDNIKLTQKGLDLANLVWEEFI